MVASVVGPFFLYFSCQTFTSTLSSAVCKDECTEEARYIRRMRDARTYAAAGERGGGRERYAPGRLARN